MYFQFVALTLPVKSLHTLAIDGIHFEPLRMYLNLMIIFGDIVCSISELNLEIINKLLA